MKPPWGEFSLRSPKCLRVQAGGWTTGHGIRRFMQARAASAFTQQYAFQRFSGICMAAATFAFGL
ncbi:MAG: hypothetical protein BJ554DRAFT_4972 [Olpidium bornovanus]|uniref:Uncharacterized protein n=1 Tax=Olpidium bornovanus TaxID=278681 RepID=A0A8H7ZKD2_9FUNG|nr:MAG: hypothetical protein BJ554DRAFT_4972 [Olpidium bornovanus]